MKTRERIVTALVLLTMCGSGWAVDSNGLVAHWKLDEGSGTTAHDSAGDNDGTLVNGPVWTTGTIDGALEFDGIDDYVDCGNDQNLNVTELTWSLWIKRAETTYSNERALISNTGPKTGPQEARGTYALQIDEGGRYQDKIQFLRHGMPVEQCPLSKTAINDMNWHHIAVTRYINGDVTIYIDGYEDATGYLPERTAYGKTFIGTGHMAYSNFKGSIDEVAIYNRALSANEIWQLYHGPIGTLVDIEIIGTEEVRKSCQGQYTAIVSYDSGYTMDVTNSAQWWVEPNTIASINANGLLNTGDINVAEDITIYAEYTEDDIIVWAEMPVLITLPQILYVPTDYNVIQSAIDAAGCGDTVVVALGTYTGPGNRDIDFLGKAITVRSESGPENCVIDCNGSRDDYHRGFYFHNDEGANSVLEGFTITNGYAWGEGGGIKCYSSSPTITNCIIETNIGRLLAGGIHCRNSSPTITNCTFSNNRASVYRGGGIVCMDKANPTIINCLFVGNKAVTFGAGISCSRDSSPKIISCTITCNKATQGAGGIYCNTATPIVTNCTIVSNSAQYGGGILCYVSGGPILTNCVMSGNTADLGDQVYLASYNETHFTEMTISYSNILGGTDGIYVEQGCTLNWGLGNIDVDPCFVDPGHLDVNNICVEGDYHLLGNSPCIDTGDPNYIAGPNETDLDGNPRVVDGDNDGNSVVDMGAFEAQLLEPAELIAELLEEVGELGLPSGIENSLMAKLNAALGAVEDENENNDIAAINTLAAFINAVEAQRGKKIPEAEADALIAAAQEIIELLSDG